MLTTLETTIQKASRRGWECWAGGGLQQGYQRGLHPIKLKGGEGASWAASYLGTTRICGAAERL